MSGASVVGVGRTSDGGLVRIVIVGRARRVAAGSVAIAIAIALDDRHFFASGFDQHLVDQPEFLGLVGVEVAVALGFLGDHARSAGRCAWRGSR